MTEGALVDANGRIRGGLRSKPSLGEGRWVGALRASRGCGGE